MSYGLELRNSQESLVLDEDNPVVVVGEKGTANANLAPAGGISGNTNGWVTIGGGGDVGYLYNIILDKEYDTPPLLAIRLAAGGLGKALPKANLWKSSNTKYNRLRLTSLRPIAVDYIIGVSSQSITPTKDTSVGFGLEIKDAANKTVFDSSWEEIVSLVDVVSMPDLGHTVTGQGTNSTTVTPEFAEITVPNSKACFFVLSGLSGVKAFNEWRYQEPGYEAYFGGGYFLPTVIPNSDTTVRLGSTRSQQGPYTGNNSDAGTTTTPGASYGGQVLILKYLNF